MDAHAQVGAGGSMAAATCHDNCGMASGHRIAGASDLRMNQSPQLPRCIRATVTRPAGSSPRPTCGHARNCHLRNLRGRRRC